MMTGDDMTLVREFAASRSDAAFAELVQRHIGLVHSAALRQAGDAHLAGDITQAVFIILARKAASLGPKTVLSAWLYRATRYAASDALKTRRRRQIREQEAFMQSTLNSGSDAPSPSGREEIWTQLAPLLDDAMNQLGETDRAALVLRYFENKTAREIATALRMEEEAAQKRVARALEKLRRLFAKHGVNSPADAITGAISANSIQIAPAALAGTVTAMAKGAAASTSILTLVKGALKIMAWTKVKPAVLIGLGVFLAAGTVVIVANQSKPVEEHSEDHSFVFTAEGLVSTEVHQNPTDTSLDFKMDGKVLFSFSNGVWWIQFIYQHQEFPPGYLDSTGRLATMIDQKRIPDGRRQILSFPPWTNDPPNVSPLALVTPDTFPDEREQGLFLPWLALCPTPELPLVSSKRIRILFDRKFFTNPENSGGFEATYIEPDRRFLSELVITNNGTIFLSDGRTMKWPAPFNNGFVTFSFKVLETTNVNGIIFPLSAVLDEFEPLPNGKSPEETYRVVHATLKVDQIDIGGRHLTLSPVPASVLAMDSRLSLPNGRTMNYGVTNDEYYALTNSKMESLANLYLRMRQGSPPRRSNSAAR